MYLIPLVPFRGAQHSAGNLDNLEMWADISISRLPWTRLYGAWIIDELLIAKITDEDEHHNWWAWQIGVQVADLYGFASNTDIVLEYTRVNPWVYRHRYPWNTCDTWSMRANTPVTPYPLGNWLGHNSDVLFGSISWRATRDLELELWGSRSRKGAQGDVDTQYSPPSEQFLFGAVTTMTELHFEARWEVLRDLLLLGSVGYVDRSSDASDERNWTQFSAGITYNVW